MIFLSVCCVAIMNPAFFASYEICAPPYEFGGAVEFRALLICC
jgi:hypothetical protein